MPFIIFVANKNFIFKNISIKNTLSSQNIGSYESQKREKIHISYFVHPRKISLTESRGSRSFFILKSTNKQSCSGNLVVHGISKKKRTRKIVCTIALSQLMRRENRREMPPESHVGLFKLIKRAMKKTFISCTSQLSEGTYTYAISICGK